MNQTMKIVGMTGSLRKGSYNRGILRYISQIVPQSVKYEIIDVTALPFYNQDFDVTGYPESVKQFKAQLRDADGVLLATPEYNYSIPPVLKNALDWASRGDEKPLFGKPAAIISASIGNLGGARVQYQLRQSLIALNVAVINKPEVFIGDAEEKFDENGELLDDKTKKYVKRLVEAFIDEIKKTK